MTRAVSERGKEALMKAANPLWAPSSIGRTYVQRFGDAIADGQYGDIYIPNPLSDNVLSLVPRTAIVGQTMRDGQIRVYFEGWVNGAFQYENLDARQKWAAGVRHAGERLLTQYPSSGSGILAYSELIHIGIYDPADRSPEGVWVAPDKLHLLTYWLNQDREVGT